MKNSQEKMYVDQEGFLTIENFSMISSSRALEKDFSFAEIPHVIWCDAKIFTLPVQKSEK